MTREEKELLFKDLSGRLPYEVKIHYHYSNGKRVVDEDRKLTFDNLESMKYDIDNPQDHWCEISWKPYLRPMSSMTKEEREEWADLFNLELDKLIEVDDEDKAEELAPYYFGKSHQVSIDWLNKKHFDYRGLIPMGLALPAPEEMYNTKQ